MNQSRIKSIVAGMGSFLTILTSVLLALQTTGVIQPATESQQDMATVIATIIGTLVSAGYQVYSHYNNPTNKSEF